MKVDAHQHFWIYDPINYAWIDDEMQILQKDFLPSDLKPILQSNNIDGCIAVQAQQTTEETSMLLKVAEENDFIRGVVGWTDLRSQNLESQLESLQEHKKLSGFRHVVQSEPDPSFMLSQDFQRGISLLEKYGFTYDILIFPTQLEAAHQTIKNFPKQKFVIDHIAKPYIKDKKIDYWASKMKEIGQLDNAWCKLSGMITEANLSAWTYDDLLPYLDTVFEAFGADKLMFGSDWPVCLLAGGYGEVVSVVRKFIAELSVGEQNGVMGENAVEFYNC